MSCFYDRQGQPITVEEWGRLWEERTEGDGFWTTSDGRYLTVYIGADDRELLGRPVSIPAVFHTISRTTGQLLASYSNEQDALADHAALNCRLDLADPLLDTADCQHGCNGDCMQSGSDVCTFSCHISDDPPVRQGDGGERDPRRARR